MGEGGVPVLSLCIRVPSSPRGLSRVSRSTRLPRESPTASHLTLDPDFVTTSVAPPALLKLSRMDCIALWSTTVPRPAVTCPGPWEGTQMGDFGEPKQRGISVFDGQGGLSRERLQGWTGGDAVRLQPAGWRGAKRRPPAQTRGQPGGGGSGWPCPRPRGVWGQQP